LELITEPAAWRRLAKEHRRRDERIGFVPTMGALHAGHLSLVEAALGLADFVGLSVFVNPLQFGDRADLEQYPRDLEADLKTAEAAGVGAVFAPAVEEMYPAGQPATVVEPGPLGQILEGASRPGHFAGVATVLTKLFSLTGPCAAFLGEKDFQQLAVVRQVVFDLDLPAEIIGCPTVRERDGLALSSRNRRLSPGERSAARCLHAALLAGRASLARGESPEEAEAAMAAVVESEPLARLDYAAVVEPESLRSPGPAPAGLLRLLVAAFVGPVRLIDNLPARS
jgi:pantoate--beta-alanine ligase